MKKRLAAAAILVLASLTTSGCYPSGEVSDTFSVEKIEETHFEYSKENLTVSFDLPEIPENIPSKIKLRKKFYDFWDVAGLFFNGETIDPEQVPEKDPKDNFAIYTSPNTTSLRTYYNKLKFYDREMLQENEIDGAVNYYGAQFFCHEFNRDICCITDEELSGFPLQGALDRANELISALGITDLGEPVVYSVSLKSYEKFYQFGWEMMFNKNYPLTEDDEVYVFEYPKIFGGIEVGYFDMKAFDTDPNGDIDDPRIYVGVAKDHIFSFYEQAYEPGYEIISDEPIQYGLDYALSKLRNYLENTYFGTSKVATINKAKLVYYPVECNEKGTLEFVPVWSFEGFFDDQRGGAPSPDRYPFCGYYKIAVRTDTGDLLEWKRIP